MSSFSIKNLIKRLSDKFEDAVSVEVRESKSNGIRQGTEEHWNMCLEEKYQMKITKFLNLW